VRLRNCITGASAKTLIVMAAFTTVGLAATAVPAGSTMRSHSELTSAGLVAPHSSSSGALDNNLTNVACTSGTQCVAVGTYIPAAGGSLPLIELWDGTSWAIVPNPIPIGDFGSLQTVSCISSSDCVAVGGTSTQPLAESWNGTTWSAMPSPDVLGTLSAVSCISSSDCVAVGGTSSSELQTLVELWNGTAWSVVSSPNPTASPESELDGVSCISSTDCVAVGLSLTGSDVPNTLVESWNGVGWTIIPSPHPGNGGANVLSSVSCTSSTNCVAVGIYSDQGIAASPTLVGSQALVESWNGSEWSVVPSPSPSIGNGGVLASVSCSSSTDCTAVGHYDTPSDVLLTLVESWNGTEWTVVPSPSPGTVQSFLQGVSCTGSTDCVAVGATANGPLVTTTLVTSWNGSTWDVSSSPNADALVSAVVGMAATPSGNGYWLADSSGDVTAHGAALNYGSLANADLNAPIVGIAATSDGQGYWLVAADGGVFSFGDAGFYGSTGGIKLNKPIVGMAATADGNGYWLVASDGGVFSFGDAQFYGSTGDMRLNEPVVGMAADGATGGYWLVARDGGIFSFNAPFYGSAANLRLNQPIVGVEAAADGSGYRLVAADGGVFDFNQPFAGSEGGETDARIVAIVPYQTGSYWIVASNGTVTAFGPAPTYP